MNLVVFEGGQVGQLEPITLGRPAYAVTCGSLRLIDLLGDLGLPIRGIVRPHLQELQRLEFPHLQGEFTAAAPTLFLNARLVPHAAWLPRLRQWIDQRRPGLVRNGELLAAAIVPSSPSSSEQTLTIGDLQSRLDQPAVTGLPDVDIQLPLLAYPHDVVRHHKDTMLDNLAFRLQGGCYREVAEGVFVADGVSLAERTVCSTENGPIILDENVQVGPFSYLQGPLYAGPDARISEHSSLKSAVSLGHTTKVGGEVSASIIEPYTNKQHHGYLGHAYLGSWVNLGAGTSNSDLKNTYGHIRVEYGNERVDTGMQFLGCIVGDYSKTAINTSIFTGKIVGACSTVYGVVTTNVPSFANYARSLGQVTEQPPEVVATTQRRVFQRRGLVQRPCDVQLLQDMYDLVRDQRDLPNQAPSL